MSTQTRTRREPTQERSRRTVARIFDATEAIVGESGVEAATTRAIAERAGVAVPSLYRFFSDRDAILDAMLEELVANLDAEAQAAEAESTPSGIDDLIEMELRLTARYFEAHSTLGALWFGGRASPAVTESVRERNRALAGRLRELGISHGFIDAGAPAKAFELAVELGDRTLQVAFHKDPAHADPEVLELGRSAITDFLGRWAA